MHLSHLPCKTERVLAHGSTATGRDDLDQDIEDYSPQSGFESLALSRPSFETRVEEDLDDAIDAIAWHFAEE